VLPPPLQLSPNRLAAIKSRALTVVMLMPPYMTSRASAASAAKSRSSTIRRWVTGTSFGRANMTFSLVGCIIVVSWGTRSCAWSRGWRYDRAARIG
jgi:hypothetical protein